MKRRIGVTFAFGFTVVLAAALLVMPGQATAVTVQATGGTTYGVGPITDVSAPCSGQNAEVEQAADPSVGYVYDDRQTPQNST